MRTINTHEYLDPMEWSPLWEKYLDEAQVFDPLAIDEITCILQIPNRSDTLLFSRSQVFHSYEDALSTLQLFASFHGFPDYKLLSQTLKEIGYFGSYKLPWACQFFTLSPLEGVENTIWINPAVIYDITKYQELHYAKMITGPNLVVPLQRYYTLLRAEIACGAFASMRKDLLQFTINSIYPLDYLDLPNTPFARSLIKRPLLKEFFTRPGEISRRYQKATILHYYDKLLNNPKDLYWENWR